MHVAEPFFSPLFESPEVMGTNLTTFKSSSCQSISLSRETAVKLDLDSTNIVCHVDRCLKIS